MIISTLVKSVQTVSDQKRDNLSGIIYLTHIKVSLTKSPFREPHQHDERHVAMEIFIQCDFVNFLISFEAGQKECYNDSACMSRLG